MSVLRSFLADLQAWPSQSSRMCHFAAYGAWPVRPHLSRDVREPSDLHAFEDRL